MKLLDSLRDIARFEKENQERSQPIETNSPPSPQGKKDQKKRVKKTSDLSPKAVNVWEEYPEFLPLKLPAKFRHPETYYEASTSIPSTLVAVRFSKLLEMMLRCHYLIP